MNDHDDCEPDLTRREYQILELVAQGYSAKEIAQAIEIAPRTVERHIDNIRLKLRARNRTHMVAKAIGAHMLTAEGRREPDKDAMFQQGAGAGQGEETEGEPFEKSFPSDFGLIGQIGPHYV